MGIVSDMAKMVEYNDVMIGVFTRQPGLFTGSEINGDRYMPRINKRATVLHASVLLLALCFSRDSCSETTGWGAIASRQPLKVSVVRKADSTIDMEGTGIPCNDDLSAPGNPSTKRSYTEGLANSSEPADFFDYNTTDYWTRVLDLHGATFEVAIHTSVLDEGGGPEAEAFSEYVFQCFHIAWHVFGGYAYDRYAVKVRAVSESTGYSLSQVGVAVSAEDYTVPYLEEFIAHEIFHSWLGLLIKYEGGPGENRFRLETWIQEGAATYYGIRHMGFVKGESHYMDGVRSRWNQYSDFSGTQFDQSVENLAAQIGESMTDSPDDNNYITMLYARSMLLNYLMDMELGKNGRSLDSLMRRLYDSYGLTGRVWKQEDIPAMLEELTGRNQDVFLNTWLHADTPITLDGNIQFLKRDALCMDIKANGSDGPISLLSNEYPRITIELDAGEYAGESADWWLAVSTPHGWYYVGAQPLSWLPFPPDAPATLQHPLLDLHEVDLSNTPGLPSGAGAYIFFFVVDLRMNGMLDISHLYYDNVVVGISPP